ncbi:sugar ABC transporter ATP-binding protein, partial [Shigella dysenteriae]
LCKQTVTIAQMIKGHSLKANLINHNLTQEQVMEAALRSEHHVEKQSV